MKLAIFAFIILASNVSAQAPSNPFAASHAKREAARQRDADRQLIRRGESSDKAAQIGAITPRPSTSEPFSTPKPPSWSVLQYVMQEGKLKRERVRENADERFDIGPDAYSAAYNEAITLYPDLTDPQSAIALRCAELQRYFQSIAHPLARNDRRPLLLAHMASMELTGQAKRDSRQLANDKEVADAKARRDAVVAEMQRQQEIERIILKALNRELFNENSTNPRREFSFRLDPFDDLPSDITSGRIMVNGESRRFTRSGTRPTITITLD